MKMKNVALAATAVSAALVLSACGSGGSGTAAGPPQAPTSSAAGEAPAPTEHNAADIAFAQGMVPHHRQAVEMSALAADRAGSDEVRQLATVIAQAQEPEIRQMQGFLTAWGAPQSGAMPGMGDGGMPGTGGMSGMMSDQQMQQLAQASGAGFDRMFLQMMIAHHEGAVQMARTEVTQGVDPEARALAQKIVDEQLSEIARMRTMLG